MSGISFRGRNTVYDGVESLRLLRELSTVDYFIFIDVDGFVRRYNRNTGLVDPLKESASSENVPPLLQLYRDECERQAEEEARAEEEFKRQWAPDEDWGWIRRPESEEEYDDEWN